MKYGVPEQTAFGMSRPVRLAAIIVYGQSEGSEWNWSAMEWVKPG